MHGLEEKYGKQITFFDANTDKPDGEAIAKELEVEAIPALFFYDASGKLVNKTVGAMSSGALEAELQKILGK